MPDFDLIIRGGTLVDGQRSPRYTTDVGITSGRIAHVGTLTDASAEREIDADGLIVAPGFVDLHTHYDGQIYWDPWCTLSGWHGVTTTVVGNCGFGFAPVAPEHRERAMLALARNEAVPLECMQEGMPWDWESFPEFMDSIDRIPKGVNVASYIGLSPLMSFVMGGFDEAKTRRPEAEEIARMCDLLREAIAVGACGWSVQLLGEQSVQRDFDGTPMLTDTLSFNDLVPFAEVLREMRSGLIQMVGPARIAERLADASGRPVLWGPIAASTDQHGAPASDYQKVIRWLNAANARGHRVFGHAMTVEPDYEFTLEDWNFFDASPLWCEVTMGTVPERLAKMADPERRAKLKTEFDSGSAPLAGGGTAAQEEVFLAHSMESILLEYVTGDDPELRAMEGFTLGELASRAGKHVIDVFLDVAVATDLKAGFATKARVVPPEVMGAIVNAPFSIPGISDGGAHTKFLTTGSYATEYLTKWVRDQELVDLETAHWRLSAYPAMAAGITDRGVIREGAAADVVVYDFENLTNLPPERAWDFPAGAWRRIRKAEGYHHTVVNGVVTFVNGECTGETPGQLLRHGAAATDQEA